MRKVTTTECASGAIRSYVQDTDLGSAVLASGRIPVRPQTGEMVEDMFDQAYQSLENVKVIVEPVGLKVNDIVKTIVFISDPNDFAIINQVYQQFFDEYKAVYPTCSCVQVARLPEDVRLKIEAIAIRGDALQSLVGRSQDRPDP